MKKVLIVDDDPTSRQLLSIILSKADEKYSIIEADSGRSALEVVEKEEPDIILLDLVMPEMDGFEVCTKLKADERYSSIPVLFITVSERPEDIIKAFKVGAADYITKSINPDVVKARVAAQLALRDVEAERLAAERLRIWKGTVAALNHNMNQPLMAAYTYINLAVERVKKADQNHMTYEKLREELGKMHLILRKISALEEVRTTEYAGDVDMVDLDWKKRKEKPE